MRTRRQLTIVAALLALLVCGAIGTGIRERPPHPFLESTLLFPQPASNGTVEAEPARTIVCRWQIKNVSRQPIEGRKVATNCQCQIAQMPPNILLPDETAEIAVSVVPPSAGDAERVIPLVVSGGSEPLGQLRIRFHVPISPPVWIMPPTAIDLRVIADSNAIQEFVWDAVEKRGSQNWIQDIHSDVDVLAAQFRVEERPWAEDGEVVARKYRIKLHSTSKTLGRFRANLLLHEGESGKKQTFPVTVEIIPPASVIPESIRLASDDQPRRVTLVLRGDQSSEITASFNCDLLKVVRVGSKSDRALKYDIIPQGALSQPTETEVFFSSTKGELARLTVRFDSMP